MTTFTIHKYNSVTQQSVNTVVEAEDWNHAARKAWELYGATHDSTQTVIIRGGVLGNKRVECLDGWHPSLWELSQRIKSKR